MEFRGVSLWGFWVANSVAILSGRDDFVFFGLVISLFSFALYLIKLGSSFIDTSLLFFEIFSWNCYDLLELLLPWFLLQISSFFVVAISFLFYGCRNSFFCGKRKSKIKNDITETKKDEIATNFWSDTFLKLKLPNF